MAAPAAAQEASLSKLRVGPDELALELNAYAGAAASLVETGELTSEAGEFVRDLDRHFEGFSGADNVGEWTMSALHSSKNWIIARELASKALALMT